jgi:hypothetical protein
MTDVWWLVQDFFIADDWNCSDFDNMRTETVAGFTDKQLAKAALDDLKRHLGLPNSQNVYLQGPFPLNNYVFHYPRA